MNSEILNQGLSLMAFGMGSVFVFLTLLVIITTFMSLAVGKLFPLTQSETKSSVSKTKAEGETQIVSAIMAAIKLHRSRRNK